MADAADPRAKLIEVAQDLFWKNGYGPTGIAQILEAAGVLRGSLYYYFPTKEDLLIATLESRKVELWPDVIQPVFERLSDPIERVFGVLDGYRQLLVIFQFKLGCPIGNLALELTESHPRVRQLLAENFTGWRDAIAGCLRDARHRLPPDADSSQLAQFILITMEGGLMLARTYRSIEPFDTAVTLLRDYFERLQADATDWSAPSS